MNSTKKLYMQTLRIYTFFFRYMWAFFFSVLRVTNSVFKHEVLITYSAISLLLVTYWWWAHMPIFCPFHEALKARGHFNKRVPLCLFGLLSAVSCTILWHIFTRFLCIKFILPKSWMMTEVLISDKQHLF